MDVHTHSTRQTISHCIIPPHSNPISLIITLLTSLSPIYIYLSRFFSHSFPRHLLLFVISSLSPSCTHVLAFSYPNPSSFSSFHCFPHRIVLPHNPPRNQVYPRTPRCSPPLSLHHIPPTLINRPHSHLASLPCLPPNPPATLLAHLVNPPANLLFLLRSPRYVLPNSLPNNPVVSLHNNLHNNLAENLRCNLHHNLPDGMEVQDNWW